MPAIPMSEVQAISMADDWLALRVCWAEVAEADRAAALDYFQNNNVLSESLLMTGTRDQIIAAYKGL